MYISQSKCCCRVCDLAVSDLENYEHGLHRYHNVNLNMTLEDETSEVVT